MDNIIPIRAAFDAYSNWGGLYIRGGNYSVTELLDAPRIIHLKNRHKDELPLQRVTDMLSAFQGNAWHLMLDKYLRAANNKDEYRNTFLTEAKFWERIEDRKIAGKLDCYHAPTKTIYDYKVTSTYKAMFGDYESYEVQLNVYAWFLRINGLQVDNLIIICIHPGWNKFDAAKDPKYPQQPIHEVKIPLWSTEQQAKLVRERVIRLRDSETMADHELPLCTDGDMWVKPAKLAIMEVGKKRASRVLGTQAEVEKYIKWREDKGNPLGKYTVEKREAERTRCLNYCPVSAFCNQYAEYLIERGED